MNLLEQLKKQTIVVSDSGDFEAIKQFKPVDATTNPSLIYKASQDIKYSTLIDDAISFAKCYAKDKEKQVGIAVDRLMIDFGIEILKIVPGRVSTEVDARLSYDMNGMVDKARSLISLYKDARIDKERVLIKLTSTWEGIKAAEILAKEGIHCNMTLLFSLPQAVASAEAGIQLISPFVGRLLDWYKKKYPDQNLSPSEEPGVKLVQNIFNYYKKFGYKTEIMGASFRNIGEIIELAGCDLLTISPELLMELEQTEGVLERKLITEKAKASNICKMDLDEQKFRKLLEEDALTTEKLADGIQKFTEDVGKLENVLLKKL
jgi:transaldolase